MPVRVVSHRIFRSAVVVGKVPFGVNAPTGRCSAGSGLFRRFRLLLPIAARLGLGARVSADEHADVNIELSAKVASNHSKILRHDSPVVAKGYAAG